MKKKNDIMRKFVTALALLMVQMGTVGAMNQLTVSRLMGETRLEAGTDGGHQSLLEGRFYLPASDFLKLYFGEEEPDVSISPIDYRIVNHNFLNRLKITEIPYGGLARLPPVSNKQGPVS